MCIRNKIKTEKKSFLNADRILPFLPLIFIIALAVCVVIYGIWRIQTDDVQGAQSKQNTEINISAYIDFNDETKQFIRDEIRKAIDTRFSESKTECEESR